MRERLAETRSDSTLSVLRTGLLAIYAAGAVGTLVELLLLEHWEGWEQWIPLALLGTSLLIQLASLLSGGRALLRAFQALMLLLVLGGLLGLILHYRGNVEFELEMTPALGGWALFREAMSGATPALAPGSMVQLGLLGLAYTFRHPMLLASRA